MTKLRERMLQDLQLRGYSDRTQEMYVRAVRKLAEHYGKSPDQITEEELRDYFLYVKNVKKWSRTASTIALCGIKPVRRRAFDRFFFEHTLKRDWPLKELMWLVHPDVCACPAPETHAGGAHSQRNPTHPCMGAF